MCLILRLTLKSSIIKVKGFINVLKHLFSRTDFDVETYPIQCWIPVVCIFNTFYPLDHCAVGEQNPMITGKVRRQKYIFS